MKEAATREAEAPSESMSAIATIAPDTANPKTGEPILTPPATRRADTAPQGPVCYSLIHDRPRVEITAGDRIGDVVDLSKKPAVYFAKDGVCSCKDADIPQPVTLGQRNKQIARAARDAAQLWVEDDPDTAKAKQRLRERARASIARK